MRNGGRRRARGGDISSGRGSHEWRRGLIKMGPTQMRRKITSKTRQCALQFYYINRTSTAVQLLVLNRSIFQHLPKKQLSCAGTRIGFFSDRHFKSSRFHSRFIKPTLILWNLMGPLSHPLQKPSPPITALWNKSEVNCYTIRLSVMFVYKRIYNQQ